MAPSLLAVKIGRVPLAYEVRDGLKVNYAVTRSTAVWGPVDDGKRSGTGA